MKKLLYLGLRPTRKIEGYEVLHCPLIATQPLVVPLSIWEKWDLYTHVILTSRVASEIFLEKAIKQGVILSQKQFICLGAATAEPLIKYGLAFDLALEENQEGVIAYLRAKQLEQKSYFLLPRSSLARKEIDHYLREKGYAFAVCNLYDTKTNVPEPLPDLKEIDAIFFTSPSTVIAFYEVFGALPEGKTLLCRGSVTEAALEKFLVN